MADQPVSCKQIFDAMPSVFNKSAAEGVNAVYQFDLSGEGGGNWNVVIANNECTVNEGSAPNPNITISMDARGYLDMLTGKLDVRNAFKTGALRIVGDVGLALRMMSLFGVAEQAPLTCGEVFEMMPVRFNQAAATGLNAIYQFDLSGEGGGKWAVSVANGECAVKAEAAAAPGVTISMSAVDFLDMVQGKLNAQVAFMNGKLRLAGDMGLALRMQAMFQL